ncbi:MAG: hypothetical protein WC213_10190, partial [Arenimonas sp.]
PLRLLWLEQSMTRQLAAGDASAAAANYRDAAKILDGQPESVNGFALHWLGAQAAASLGDEAGAAVARARATEALRKFRGGLRKDLLVHFNAAPSVRAFEGADHGP